MGPEVLVIAGIAVLLFGANKIPRLAHSVGQSVGEFEKGKTKAEQELEDIRTEVDETVNDDGEGR